MEVDNSDFSLKFEESYEKRSGCFNRLQNVTASHTVVQLLFEWSGSQLVTPSLPVNWTVLYEKYRSIYYCDTMRSTVVFTTAIQ